MEQSDIAKNSPSSGGPPLDALLTLVQLVGAVSLWDTLDPLYDNVQEGSVAALLGYILMLSFVSIGILHGVGAAISFSEDHYESNWAMLGINWMVSTYGFVIYYITLQVQGTADTVPVGAAGSAAIQTVVLWIALYGVGSRASLFYWFLTVWSVGALIALAVYLSIEYRFEVCEVKALTYGDDNNYVVLWSTSCDWNVRRLADEWSTAFDFVQYTDDISGSSDDAYVSWLAWLSLVSIVMTGASFVQTVVKARMQLQQPDFSYRRKIWLWLIAFGWLVVYPLFEFQRIFPRLLDWIETLLLSRNRYYDDGTIENIPHKISRSEMRWRTVWRKVRR